MNWRETWAAWKGAFKSDYDFNLRQLLLLEHVGLLVCLVSAALLPELRELLVMLVTTLGLLWFSHVLLVPVKGPNFVLSEEATKGWLSSYMVTTTTLASVTGAVAADQVDAWLDAQLRLGLPLAG